MITNFGVLITQVAKNQNLVSLDLNLNLIVPFSQNTWEYWFVVSHHTFSTI